MDFYHVLEEEHPKTSRTEHKTPLNISSPFPIQTPGTNNVTESDSQYKNFSEQQENLFVVQNPIGTHRKNHSKHEHTKAVKEKETIPDLISLGIVSTVSDFSDKYAIVVALELYNLIPSEESFTIFLWTFVLIFGLSLLKFLLYDPSIDPERALVRFSKEVIDNLSNAIIIFGLKYFTVAMEVMLSIKDFCGFFISLLLPIFILKTVPFLINWLGLVFLSNKHSQKFTLNDSDIVNHVFTSNEPERQQLQGQVKQKPEKEEQEEAKKRIERLSLYVGQISGSFIEKYSLLVALDVYKNVSLVSELLRFEWFVIGLLAMWILCLFRSVLLDFGEKKFMNLSFLWQFIDSLIHYLLQLLVVLEIKYFASNIMYFWEGEMGDLLEYLPSFSIWITVIAFRTVVIHNADVRLSTSISEFVDAFIDRYILIISFTIQVKVSLSSDGIPDWEVLLLLVLLNSVFYFFKTLFELFQEESSLGIILVWSFASQVFLFATHVASIVSLKKFATIIRTVTVYDGTWLSYVVLLLMPFLLLHLVPEIYLSFSKKLSKY